MAASGLLWTQGASRSSSEWDCKPAPAPRSINRDFGGRPGDPISPAQYSCQGVQIGSIQKLKAVMRSGFPSLHA
jgi:hypothetical protein